MNKMSEEEGVATEIRQKVQGLNDAISAAERLGMQVYLSSVKPGTGGKLPCNPVFQVGEIKKTTVY